MTTRNERILLVIKHFCDGNKAKFARLMGTTPQTVNSWVTRNAGDNVTKKILSRFQEISPEWLLLGIGEMIVKEEEPLKEDNSANPAPNRLNHDGQVDVPLVNQYAYGGYLNGYENETYMKYLPKLKYTPNGELNGNYIAFEVKGDSMDNGMKNSLSAGDIIICQEIPHHLWKDSKLTLRRCYFVIVHEEGIIVKAITEHDVENHTITVHSLNSFYPDRVIDLTKVKQIFGVVQRRDNPTM